MRMLEVLAIATSFCGRLAAAWKLAMPYGHPPVYPPFSTANPRPDLGYSGAVLHATHQMSNNCQAKAGRRSAIEAVPVDSKFVTSLARPGGNLTGLSSMASDLAGKRIQSYHRALPLCSHEHRIAA